jgi:hypothetical protein
LVLFIVANALSFAIKYIRRSPLVKLIAKLLAIRNGGIYIVEKGGAYFEAQHNTKDGYRRGLQAARKAVDGG